MRARDALLRELRVFARRAPDLFDASRPLVVGYSGGQDSTALVHALAHWRPALLVRAVHVDHGLRAESAEIAEQVRTVGEALGVAVEVVRVDVPAYRRTRPGYSVQQAARAARYHALGQAAAGDASAVVVAHSADDQMETLLLRLMRGTGLDGLAGMRADDSMDAAELGPVPSEWRESARPFRLARPLLRVSRSTTLAYCSALALPIVEDVSNRSRAYTRNRVRLDLVPALETFNTDVRTVLARTAELIADDAAALAELIAATEASLLHTVSADTRRYDRERWGGLGRAIQRRVLRRALEHLTGDLANVRAAPIDDALGVLASATSRATYHLPYGITLIVEPEAFCLTTLGSAARPQRPIQKSKKLESSRV
jgi:tRNA(Ile)-lysidine synthetase-like protein